MHACKNLDSHLNESGSLVCVPEAQVTVQLYLHSYLVQLNNNYKKHKLVTNGRSEQGEFATAVIVRDC